MSCFASLVLPALSFVSFAAAGEVDSGVRKQVRIVPSGRIAPSEDDFVRRQNRKEKLSMNPERAEVIFDEAIYTVDGISYRRAGGRSCANTTGVLTIDSDDSAKVNVTPTQCLGECNKDPTCSCTRYSRYYGMKCWKMNNCPSQGHRVAECDRTDRFDTYIRTGTPSNVPTPPTPGWLPPPTLAPTPAAPTLAPTPAGWEVFGTDIFCLHAQLTHRHGLTPAGTYASQAACEALCASAHACKFYLWRHDENANAKWTCATFDSCDNPVPYVDGDGGHVWKKPPTAAPLPNKNGMVDLGMGRCCVDDHSPLCKDAKNIFLRDEGATCEQSCAGDPQCFGYSATNESAGVSGGHCWKWTEQQLRFGGDTQGWEGAHCHVKSCVTTSSCKTCSDVSGWTNGFGFGCYSYQVHFCEGGKAKPGQEHWLGDGMKNPERNCCACGGGSTQ